MSNSAGHFWRSIACSLALVSSGLSRDEALLLFAALMLGFYFLSLFLTRKRARGLSGRKFDTRAEFEFLKIPGSFKLSLGFHTLSTLSP